MDVADVRLLGNQVSNGSSDVATAPTAASMSVARVRPPGDAAVGKCSGSRDARRLSGACAKPMLGLPVAVRAGSEGLTVGLGLLGSSGEAMMAALAGPRDRDEVGGSETQCRHGRRQKPGRIRSHRPHDL